MINMHKKKGVKYIHILNWNSNDSLERGRLMQRIEGTTHMQHPKKIYALAQTQMVILDLLKCIQIWKIVKFVSSNLNKQPLVQNSSAYILRTITVSDKFGKGGPIYSLHGEKYGNKPQLPASEHEQRPLLLHLRNATADNGYSTSWENAHLLGN